MILYFKIDEKNRLWLLFSSGVKVRQKFINEEMIVEEEKNRNRFGKPERIMSPMLVISQKQPVRAPPAFQNKVKINYGYVSTRAFEKGTCLNCCTRNEPQHIYETNIGQIVHAYDLGILDEESKVVRAKLDSERVQRALLA
jgi:hypothetical protein